MLLLPGLLEITSHACVLLILYREEYPSCSQCTAVALVQIIPVLLEKNPEKFGSSLRNCKVDIYMPPSKLLMLTYPFLSSNSSFERQIIKVTHLFLGLLVYIFGSGRNSTLTKINIYQVILFNVYKFYGCVLA